jgi:hypothetical protein
MKLLVATVWILISLVLSACGIGPHQMNGVSGRERTEYLNSIKPYGARWVKEGMTHESRRSDSWACGAAGTVHAADHVVFTPEQRQSVRTSGDKDDFGPDKRLLDQWRVCMGSKGYAYLEQCDARCLHP